MNQGEMEKLAKVVAKEAVAETFLMLGVNISSPEAVQSVQGQFAFLRNMQYAARKARDVAITAVGGLVVTGICWAVWASIKAPAAATAVIH